MKQSTSRKEPSSKAMGFGVLGAAVLLAVGTAIAWGPSGAGAPQTQAEGTESSTIRNVDGGSDYFKRFSNSLPIDPSYFPIGVWLESLTDPADAPKDRAIGINTYVELTGNSDVAHAVNAGSFALTSAPLSAAAGRVLSDEVDMWAGAGSAAWTGSGPGEGQICEPADQGCGFTIQRELLKTMPEQSLVYSNYGKGVTFWEGDADAATFLNEFQDVVSADNYWFTDPFICGPSEGGAVLAGGQQLEPEKCRLAANYGWTVSKLRSLIKPAFSKPVWAFVEVGHPFTENDAPTITGPEIRAAVWSSLIHGARGIVYFNHSFGGTCPTQHILRESCGDEIRPWVTAVNRQIAGLAPVLNAPFLDGALAHAAGVDATVKVHGNDLYVFAGSAQPGPQEAEFTLGCLPGTTITATVLDEDRTVAISNGAFRDTFADGNAVHLYRIDGAAAACTP
jgi:hypothetical protein